MRFSIRSVALAAAIVVGLGAAVLYSDRGSDDGPPNILIVITDDQRARGTLGVMPAVTRWFSKEGTTFTNAFTTTPLCCPARSSMFSGRYVHNHGVKHNYQSGMLDQDETLQAWLQQAGYRTGIAGKFLNHWGRDIDPPHFDRWSIFLHGEYYDRIFNVDGQVGPVADYTTDVVRDHALEYLDDFESDDAEPWFLYVATGAAHAPFTAEPRYEDATVPDQDSDPSLMERDTSDKPGFIARRSKRKNVREKQLRTLMSANDLVDAVFEHLEATDELDNTVALFTSDNGMLWGEHGFTGKRHAYTDSIRVPLLVRWPGHLAAGATDDRLAANIDLAPTLLDAARIEPPPTLDGASLLGPHRRSTILLEQWSDDDTTIPDWASLRSDTFQYIEYYRPGGSVRFREYYDLEHDPYELRNLLQTGGAPPIEALHRKLAQYRKCLGNTCP